ncbi:MAG: hypothetical protein KHY08_14255 [Lachnospiraceae bacterium]|jgi:hypothetical protein|nr:hypothetical protein [Lachnospiraceae bacterium]
MMEIDSNPITKPSKKGTILSAVFYALAVVLLITAFVSLVVCHQNISRQLEQGVPVQGNELAIVNLYLTSCVQYFALAGAMVFFGKAARRVLAIPSEAPVQVTPYMLNAPAEAPGSTFTEEVEPEDDDTDFEAWGFREKEE